MAQTRDVSRHLARGKLSAFAGLGALGDFDFEFVGVHEVVGGHPETAGGHLLHAVVRFALLRVYDGILSALAGIAAATKTIHGNGERAMSFGRNRAQRHRLRTEAGEQRRLGLNIIHLDRSGIAHFQQIADGTGFPLAGQGAVGLEILVGRPFDVAMQAAHDFRRTGMPLPCWRKR